MTPGRNTQQQMRDRERIRRGKPACHICGEPIDYSLVWPDARCYVVDHIKPLHKGGTDTLDNKAAAHNDCNSRKRARLVAPIVRRSGSLN